MECLKCKKYSGKSLYCRECRKIKENAGAIISQNKKKLKKILNEKEITPDRFIKFTLYTEHIRSNTTIYLQYKETKTKYNLTRIINGFTVIFCIISLFFGFEIYLVS